MPYPKFQLFILCLFFLINCKESKLEETPTEDTAQSIIQQSIDVSGSALLINSDFSFTFRSIAYRAWRSNGEFSLIRIKTEKKDWIVDSLTNDSFTRKLNNRIVNVQDSMAVKYSASVNSVHYFSVLPYGLNDVAVNKTLLKDISVKNKTYHTIKVTFNQEGGGEDFEDIFMYWIHTQTKKIDYLAYSYNENDGKGIRFREANNERFVEGIRFVDYNNYKPESSSIALKDLPQLFENGNLNLLSKIELENIKVKLN